MALTRSFKETIQARANRDSKFRDALLTEGVEALLTGEVDLGKAILRDYINATIGFGPLAIATGSQPKSLMRMLGPSGNPTAKNLMAIIGYLQRERGLSLQVRTGWKGTCSQNPELLDRVHDWNLIGIPVVWIALLKPMWQKNIRKSKGSYTIEKTTLRDFEKQMLQRYGHIWYFDPDTRNFYKGTVKSHLLYQDPQDYFDQNAGELVQTNGHYYSSARWIDLVLDEPIPLDLVGLKLFPRQDKKGVKVKIYDWCILNGKEIDTHEEKVTVPVNLPA